VRPSRYPFVISALIFAASAGGCSLVLDADQPQCKVDADCVSRGAPTARCVASLCVLDADSAGAGGSGGEAGTAGDGGAAGEAGSAGKPITDPKWSCLGQIPTPVGETATVHVQLPLEDFISQVPRPGVTVHVCGRLDPTCATPLSDPVITDDKGIATHTFVLSQYRALVEAGGNVWNDARGHIFIESLDCADQPTAGVTYSIPKLEPDTVRVFLRDGVPDRNAPDTDATGIGGFILAGEGFHTVTGTLSVDGTQVNERRIFVRPATFSYTVMSPRP
jgi:hypothetical protein